jgi:hypothetical protein
MEFLLPLVLMFLSVFTLLAGLYSLADAAEGLGWIAAAGVIAVFYLIVQSHNQHKEIKRLLGEVPPEKPPTLSDLGRMRKEKEARRSDSKFT